ncbi:MAG: outer membrane beta-barrel protein [Bacteroidales bacterium]
MKKLSLIFVILFSAATLFAQEEEGIDLNPWSVGLDGGIHAYMHPIDADVAPELYDPGFARLSGRYMFNDNWGIMGSAQYDLFMLEEGDVQTHFVGITGQAVMELGNMMNFESWTNHLGLMMHIGVGGAAMWQPDRFDEDNTSRLFDQADEMIMFSAGISPYVKLNENWAINLDYGFNYNIEQSRPFDMGELNEEPALSGRFMTMSIGVSYHFGEHSSKPYLLF